MKKLFLLTITFFLSINIVKSQTLTQSQTSLGVYPAVIETVVDDKGSVFKEITLTNLSNVAQPIKTLKQSFSPSEKVYLTKDELAIYDASSWIIIPPEDTDFILQPLESKIINIEIRKPFNANPGGHYATIYFQPLIPQELVSKDSIFIYSRVAVVLFMQVPGDIVQKLEFGDIKVNSLYNPGPFEININIKNTGNTHIQPLGKINIYDNFNGELIKTIPIDSTVFLPKVLKTLPIEIDIQKTFGVYSLKIEIVYGAESIVLSSNNYNFVIFPYSFSFFVLIPSILIVGFVLKFRKRFKLAYKEFKKG